MYVLFIIPYNYFSSMIAIALRNEKKSSNEETTKMIIDFPKDNSEISTSNETLKLVSPLHYRTTCAFDPVQIAGSPPGGALHI